MNEDNFPVDDRLAPIYGLAAGTVRTTVRIGAAILGVFLLLNLGAYLFDKPVLTDAVLDRLEVIDSVGPDGREEELVGLRLDVDVNAGWWATVRAGGRAVREDGNVKGADL